MRTPEQFVELVQARVAANWQGDVAGAGATWPENVDLGSPSQDELEDSFDEYQEQIDRWRGWTEVNGLELASSLRRVNGEIRSIPTHVTVPDLDTAARIAGGDWEARVQRGRDHAALLESRFPGVAGLSLVVRAVDRFSDGDFDLLTATARWFREDPQSGLDVREIPVDGLHREWLERHESLVRTLAGVESLGLASSEPSRIHFRYLDPDHQTEGGRQHDSATVGDVMQPAYRPDIVLICEDASTAAHIPRLSLAVAIEGGGADTANAIASFEWIAEASHIIYWGHLDATSLETVNQLRVLGLSVSSILMDLATFNRYERFGVADPDGIVPARAELPSLTASEQALYETLTDPEFAGARSVPQDRIPLVEAAKAMARILATRG
jgi:hypothetical protein